MDKKESQKGFFQTFRKDLKAKIIAAIFAIFAAVGLVCLDELKIFTREIFFYGTVKITAEDQNLKQLSQITIFDADHNPKSTFPFKTQTSTKLAPGNYFIQIHYPKPDGSKEIIFEKPFEIKRRKHETIVVTYKLPNIITVKLDLPKAEFVREEQIYFTVTSDKDGYIWVFAPDDKGNPNQIFPNESYKDNRIKAGKKFTIPPYDTFTMQTRSTPGYEEIVSIVSEIYDRQFALSCLKKIIPSISIKISVTHEALWGYDKKSIKVK